MLFRSGLVSSPVTRDRWWATKGGGSFYNGNQIRVSSVDTLSESQSFFGGLYGQETRNQPSKLLPLLEKTYRQRGFGDYYAHVLVAMGCGEFAVDYGLNPWDTAPLKILLEEAGGVVLNLDGRADIYSSVFISSNKAIADTVLSELR